MSAVLAALALAVTFTAGTPAGRAQAATLLSQGKPATASSVENAGFPASAAVDGNTGTRWSSAFSDPQWIQVDLGATASISQVVLHWEAAYATAFQIQTSPDAHELDHDLLDDHGHRRHPDAQHHRHRPLRADVRHRPRPPVRLLAVGVPGLRHRGRRIVQHHRRRAEPPRHRLLAGERHRSPRPARSTATPAPAGPAPSPTRSGSRSTSAPRQSICQVTLDWEAAYAKAFQIQTSPDATTWTTIYSTTTGTGGTQTLTVSGTGRYVRMYGTARGHPVRLLPVGVQRLRRRAGTPGGGGSGHRPRRSGATRAPSPRLTMSSKSRS